MKDHDFDGAPCLNDPPMWESTSPIDHAWAARICKTECDHMAACIERLTQVQELARTLTPSGGGPEGTWAGRLIGAPKKKGRPRKKAA